METFKIGATVPSQLMQLREKVILNKLKLEKCSTRPEQSWTVALRRVGGNTIEEGCIEEGGTIELFKSKAGCLGFKRLSGVL